LSWADSYRDGADEWFDLLINKLEPFDVTLTFCFTPTHCGLVPNHTSPPKDIGEFAEFCARMTRRYSN
jgi:beta-xylosidase